MKHALLAVAFLFIPSIAFAARTPKPKVVHLDITINVDNQESKLSKDAKFGRKFSFKDKAKGCKSLRLYMTPKIDKNGNVKLNGVAKSPDCKHKKSHLTRFKLNIPKDGEQVVEHKTPEHTFKITIRPNY